MNATAVRLVRAVNRNWTNSIRLAPPGWNALTQELDLWQRRGRQARFWWRDDDACDATPALTRLLELKESHDIPLAIAAVPATATVGLAHALDRSRGISVLQHGWSHRNHAAPGRPRAELAEGRDAGEVEAELGRGLMKLLDLFGERFLPVLVPPFNFLARSLAGAVASAGFSTVSVEGDFAGLPLPCRNVHIDPIDWRQPCAKDPAALIRQAVGALRLRRFGLVPATMPVGIVTHHLQHDEDVWRLTGALLGKLTHHPAASFTPTVAVFAP